MAASNSSEVYKLGRDCLASGRLTLQHWAVADLIGLISPHVLKSWSQDDPATPRRVADVACGNAIWSMQVAESDFAKDLQVTGFDLSPSQFPPKEDWPSNVDLRTWNVFTPPAKEYEGFFDLVNIRLVIFAIPDGDPRPILHNVLKLLKPGGTLQWMEFDVLSPSAGPNSAYARIWDTATAAMGSMNHRWIQEMDSIFAELGMQDVKLITKWPAKSKRKYWVDIFMMGYQEMMRGWPTTALEELYVECEKERTEQGVVPLVPTNFCVGTKSV